MRTFVESLSIFSGGALIVFLSVPVVWLLCIVFPRSLHPLWVVIVPFIFAYNLYWLPVWLGADPVGYGVWAFLGVGTWFLAGFFPSAGLTLIIRNRGAR